MIGFFHEYSNGFQFFAEQVIGCLGDMQVKFQDRELKDEWISACQNLGRALQIVETDLPLGALDSMVAGLQALISKTENRTGGQQSDAEQPITNIPFWRNAITRCQVCPRALKGEMLRMLNDINICLDTHQEVNEAVVCCMEEVKTKLTTLKEANIGHCRPDALAVGTSSRYLALVEFTRGADYDDDFMDRIDLFKTARYARAQETIQALLPGWTIEILCFTVGIRGSIPKLRFKTNLAKLGVDEIYHEKIMRTIASETFKGMHSILDVRAIQMDFLRANQFSSQSHNKHQLGPSSQ